MMRRVPVHAIEVDCDSAFIGYGAHQLVSSAATDCSISLGCPSFKLRSLCSRAPLTAVMQAIRHRHCNSFASCAV